MTSCLPGTSLKHEKMSAAKKISMPGIQEGRKQELSPAPAMGKAS